MNQSVIQSVCGSLCRLDDEKKARKELEKEVDDLKKTIDDTKLNRNQTQKEIDMVKQELARLQLEHKVVRSTKAPQGQLTKVCVDM